MKMKKTNNNNNNNNRNNNKKAIRNAKRIERFGPNFLVIPFCDLVVRTPSDDVLMTDAHGQAADTQILQGYASPPQIAIL